MNLRPAPFILLLALPLSSCRQRPSSATPDVSPTVSSASSSNPSNVGGISGVVTFTGHAPPRVRLDVSADPGCNRANLPAFTEQIVVTNHNLANVFVYLKSGAPDQIAPAGSPSVVVDQRGCRYIPHVVAVQQGGAVEFVNSDATVHNITTLPTQPGNPTVNFSQSANSAPHSEIFKHPEVMLPVRCRHHPWMNALINVAPNAWFDVTSSDGAFHIAGIPPGVYTLAAVQEKLGEQDVQVTVAPGTVAQVNFTFPAR
ncbi:MAG: carboxypeptidase regulatory-like domain-containing protein [Acidobacteriaceae bacterium]